MIRYLVLASTLTACALNDEPQRVTFDFMLATELALDQSLCGGDNCLGDHVVLPPVVLDVAQHVHELEPYRAAGQLELAPVGPIYPEIVMGDVRIPPFSVHVGPAGSTAVGDPGVVLWSQWAFPAMAVRNGDHDAVRQLLEPGQPVALLFEMTGIADQPVSSDWPVTWQLEVRATSQLTYQGDPTGLFE